MISENTIRWYTLPAYEVVQRLSTDPEMGLTEREAHARQKSGGENEIFRIPHESFGSYMRRMAISPLSVLLLILLALNAFLGNFVAFAVIAVTIIVAFAIKCLTFIKSNRVLEDMGQYSLPYATVIRDGKKTTISQCYLVPGDVIDIESGQIIPADARLIESERLVVIETGITEAVGNVTKNADAWDARIKRPHEQTNMVFASTLVISGSGKAVVTETGKNTLVGSTGKNAPAITYEKMGLFGKLRSISYFAGLILIILTALLTVANILLPGEMSSLDGLILALTFCSAMMSESLVVFGYLTVAVGVYGTLDKKKSFNTGTLVRKIERLETLRDINTLMIPVESLCDENSIRLDKMYVYDRLLDIDHEGPISEEAKQLLIKAVISTGKYDAQRMMNQSTRNTYEEDAIKNCARSYGLYNIELDDKYKIKGHSGTNEAPFETTLIEWYGENRIILRGEVSDVLKCCSYCKPEGSNILAPMTPLARRAIETTAKQMMRQSHKVLAIASGVSKYNTLLKFSDLYNDLTFEGIIGFNEPILPGAARSISRCRDAGIKVLLFTNDISEKNEYFASTMGIAPMGGDFSASADEYNGVGDENFLNRLDDIRLFQGYSVADRRKIIRLLKSKGEKVAYHARSTKEIILNLESDIGVTDALTMSRKMSRKDLGNEGYQASRGDAMRFCSDVIVSPVSEDGKGGFNALVRAIGSAKSIFVIMKRIISYLLSVNLMRLILLFVTVFSAGKFAMVSPVLTVISGLVFDFIMVFAIAFSKNERDVIKRRVSGGRFVIDLKEVISSCIGGASAALFVIIGCIILRSVYSFGSGALLSAAFISMLLSSVVFYIEGRYKTTIVGKSFEIGSVFAFDILVFTLFITFCMLIPFLSSLFGIVKITSLAGWMIIIAIPICVFGVSEVTKAVQTVIEEKMTKKDKADI